jgi:hypothetical protein
VKFRRRVLTTGEEQRLVALILALRDAALTELRTAIPTIAALSSVGRTINRLPALWLSCFFRCGPVDLRPRR